MNIYIVNRQSHYKGPFDIIDSYRKQLINVGDVCLRESEDGIAFLFVYKTENTWSSCLCVGVGRYNTSNQLKESLLFSFDGIHGRKGNASTLNQLLLCFREKVIVDFFINAIDILKFKKDTWDLTLFQQFFSPVKTLISQEESDVFEPKPDNDRPMPSGVVVKEVKKENDSTFLINQSSNKETRKLFKQYKNGDKKAFDKLVKENLHLVHKIAFSYRNKGVEYDDLVQDGTIGLIRAIERFDLSHKVPFSLYAKWWIIQALIESIKTTPYTVKVPPAQISLYFKVKKNIERYEQEHGYEPSAVEIDIEEDVDPEVLAFISSLPDDLNKLISRTDNWEEFPSNDFPTDDILMKESRTHYVNAIIGKLKRKEASIIKKIYGIGGETETLDEIGERFNLSRERVRQIKEKAIRKLRGILKVKKGEKKDEFEDEETQEKELSIEETERKDYVRKELNRRTGNINNQISNIIEFKTFKIINADDGCKIRDYQNSLVFSSKGNIKSVEGVLYHLRLQKSYFTIYLLKKNENEFKIGELVIHANNPSPLYQSLDGDIYYNQVESIRRDNSSNQYEVFVNGKWYDESGRPLIDNTITSTKEIDWGINKKFEDVIKEENTSDEKGHNNAGAEIGNVIKYDSKECTVIKKMTGRLVVKYGNGTIDNVKDDIERYEIISKAIPQVEAVAEIREDKEEETEEIPLIDFKDSEETIDDLEIEDVYVDIPSADSYIELEIASPDSIQGEEKSMINATMVEEVYKDEKFDPMPLLLENNYVNENFVFWSDDNKHIYEAYIQDDTYYIISELLIDRPNHCVHRNRVGKITMGSWMFMQMEQENIFNLESIVHYVANYTVFHFHVLQPDKTIKDKYFDYKGREIDAPDVVTTKYKNDKKKEQLHDYIDVPVSKATFGVEILRTSSYVSITRILNGVSKIIALFPLRSDFGRMYYGLNKRNIRLGKKNKLSTNDYNKLKNYISESCLVYRSDINSFTAKCYKNSTIYLYKYDLKGKLINEVKFSKSGDLNQIT